MKLFRVFLLFPVVISIGGFYARRAVAAEAAKIPFPVFALVFVALSLLNSVTPSIDAVAPTFALIMAPPIEVST